VGGGIPRFTAFVCFSRAATPMLIPVTTSQWSRYPKSRFGACGFMRGCGWLSDAYIRFIECQLGSRILCLDLNNSFT
jgi:hypothetical protein